MADNRTMAELLRAPTEGYAEAIVVPPILAEQFELKRSLINMMTTDQFFRLEKDNPHDHIRWGSPPMARKRTPAFDESFHEAWDRYKDLLLTCPHYGFTELHQLDTFYNALNPADQDSLNAAAGGNLLERTPVKAVEETCVTCGGAHPFYQCLATGGNTFPEFRDNIQGYGSAAITQIDMMKNELGNEMKSSIQTSLSNQTNAIKNMMASLLQMNTTSTSSSGTLPSNTVANPKDDLKAITTRSGVSYDGPQILPLVVENKPEATKDTVNPTNNETLKTSNLRKSNLSPRNDERNREKAKDEIEIFYQIFKDMSFKISFVDALILMPKFASTLKALIGNKERLSEMARTLLNEHCSMVLLKKLPKKLGDPGKFLIPCDFPGMAECLALEDLDASINLMP
nr:hypothetical protein [Tanacetum cinerariifolium]